MATTRARSGQEAARKWTPGDSADTLIYAERELAQTMSRVVECHRITGEACFLMHAHVESIEALDTVLDALLAYGQTTTSLVQSTPVSLRSLALQNPGR